MPVTVKIPTQLRSATGGAATAEVDGQTVGQVLDALFAEHPELKDRLSDPDGGLRRFVNDWSREGPTHHGTLGRGHHVENLRAVATMFDLPLVVVG